MLKTGGPKKNDVYFGCDPGVALDHARVCDYIAVIDAFEAVFETTVKIVQYETLKQDPKGFALASLAAIQPGLGEGRDLVQPLPEERNRSPSPIAIWIAEISAVLARKMGLRNPETNTLLTRAEHQAMCALGDRVNAALVERAAHVGQDYVPYPASERKNLMFRDEVDFDKWVRVASDIAQAPKPWLSGLGRRTAGRIRRQFQRR
ncbi:hypothetical protein AIOL_003555 [Candidatus Rhodobacter oscarellae]|uniref:Uncharacterized protein n=2 Tax=Candidatus Rhodobacter oscarellae TaxID=1675527 RepID=A0A0J9E782_9RHOB|nr:hypothetical protein AIOL_003555 [Candidatus Rhodobacter lobularis]